MKKSVTIWNCIVPGEVITRPKIVGTILVNKDYTRDDVFNLCNWGSYSDTCPDELINFNISNAGRGLLLFMDNKYHLALSKGWFEAEAMNAELEYIIYLLQQGDTLFEPDSLPKINKRM